MSNTTKQINRQWHLVDTSENKAGRVAAYVATLLIGKGKEDYRPEADMGDFVVAINVGALKFTGKKLDQKEYHKFTGYQGHLKTKKLGQLMKEDPKKVFFVAVRNMLPKNRLRNDRLKRLKLFVDDKHDLPNVKFAK